MKWWLVASGIAAAAVGLQVSLLPSAATPSVASIEWAPSARGVVHVHSRRSDGGGSVAEIAAAAARAGLDFVIVTDHGDGVREPDPAVYRSGVLCIDAVEIGTTGGHVVALGLPAAPYPLGGAPAEVVEDIARLGGVSIAAHPDSSKPEMRWIDWETPIDGLEWLNGDSEWRDEEALTLARVLIAYPFAGTRALSLALDRPEATLGRWDGLLRRRPVVALAGADAHARLGVNEDASASTSAVLRVPSYEAVFGMFSVTVSPVTLTRNASVDARAILDAIRRGHAHSSVDALAAPARLAFKATAGTQLAGAGDVFEPGMPAAIEVDTNAPTGARITLFRDGTSLATATETRLRVDAPGPGVYRVEVDLPGAPGHPPVPWIVSNPIYVGARTSPVRQSPIALRPSDGTVVRYPGATSADWAVETSARSKADVNEARTARGRQMGFRWALGGTRSESPFAAATLPVGATFGEQRRLIVTARASAPMRMSVQLRVPSGGAGERWRKSVYLDTESREISIPLEEMTPVGTVPTPPPLGGVRDLLFVVDTVNTALGTSGQIWIERIAYARE